MKKRLVVMSSSFFIQTWAKNRVSNYSQVLSSYLARTMFLYFSAFDFFFLLVMNVALNAFIFYVFTIALSAFILYALLDLGSVALRFLDNLYTRALILALLEIAQTNWRQRFIITLLVFDSISIKPSVMNLDSADSANTPLPHPSRPPLYEQQRFTLQRHFDYRNLEHSGVRRMLLVMSGLEQ